LADNEIVLTHVSKTRTHSSTLSRIELILGRGKSSHSNGRTRLWDPHSLFSKPPPLLDEPHFVSLPLSASLLINHHVFPHPPDPLMLPHKALTTPNHHHPLRKFGDGTPNSASGRIEVEEMVVKREGEEAKEWAAHVEP